MRYVYILSRQRRENYDLKEGKIESKDEDGDPVPIFPVSPPVRIEWVSLPLKPAVNVHFQTKILTQNQRQMTIVRIRV